MDVELETVRDIVVKVIRPLVPPRCTIRYEDDGFEFQTNGWYFKVKMEKLPEKR